MTDKFLGPTPQRTLAEVFLKPSRRIVCCGLLSQIEVGLSLFFIFPKSSIVVVAVYAVWIINRNACIIRDAKYPIGLHMRPICGSICYKQPLVQ